MFIDTIFYKSILKLQAIDGLIQRQKTNSFYGPFCAAGNSSEPIADKLQSPKLTLLLV